MYSQGLAYLSQFDRNLWVLSLGWFVSALGFAIAIPFIGIYFHAEFGMSITEIGVFFGVMAVVRSTFQAIGGEVSDRIERRQLLIAAQVARSVAFVLLALSIQWHWGFWWCAAWLLINSVFGAVFQPVANAVVSDILPDEQRLDGYAITRTAGNIGWAVGPAIGGFLASSSFQVYLPPGWTDDGTLAIASYGVLFAVSSVITLLSSVIFMVYLRVDQARGQIDRFRLRDLIAIKDEPHLAAHCTLIFVLYLVVAQLIMPFSIFTVEMVGISEAQLGVLFGLNGLLVALLQIPITRLLARYSLTAQLAWGALLYAFGYGMVGALIGFWYFVLAITVVTVGEMFMSPPSLTLTSRLAPPGRMGRYMGIFGFFVAAGWSFGPLYGGFILDHLGQRPAVAWLAISSLALLPAAGYILFARLLPEKVNGRSRGPST